MIGTVCNQLVFLAAVLLGRCYVTPGDSTKEALTELSLSFAHGLGHRTLRGPRLTSDMTQAMPLKGNKRKGKPPGHAHKETASPVRVLANQNINKFLSVGRQLRRTTTTLITTPRKG